MRAVLALALLAARPAAASQSYQATQAQTEDAVLDEPQGDTERAPDFEQRVADTYWDELAREAASRLESDEDAAKALTIRITQSQIAQVITGAKDEAQAAEDILTWIHKNPKDAAYLAVGFSQDDARGVDDFEKSLFHRIRRYFEMNPDRYKGIYGRLHGLASVSKQLETSRRLPEEQRRELIKRFFEGKGARADLHVQDADGDGPGGAGLPGGAVADRRDAVVASRPSLPGSGIFERLGAASPAKFSAGVMSLQNELNRFRPPGAPKLAENGKLGYETLRYPYYVLRYDIERLEAALKSQEAHVAARAKRGAGKGAKPLDKEGLERGFERRRELLGRARGAMERFDAEAAKTKDPAKISPPLLRALSGSHREAARWITAAALEERIQRLESLRGFLDPPLLGAISRTPVEEETRRLYVERGRRLGEDLEAAIADARRLGELLRRGIAGGDFKEADRLDRASRSAAKRLPMEIAQYVEAPYRLIEARRPVSRLRALVDPWVLRLLPDISYSRRLRRRMDQEKALVDEFQRIAALR